MRSTLTARSARINRFTLSWDSRNKVAGVGAKSSWLILLYEAKVVYVGPIFLKATSNTPASCQLVAGSLHYRALIGYDTRDLEYYVP